MMQYIVETSTATLAVTLHFLKPESELPPRQPQFSGRLSNVATGSFDCSPHDRIFYRRKRFAVLAKQADQLTNRGLFFMPRLRFDDATIPGKRQPAWDAHSVRPDEKVS